MNAAILLKTPPHEPHLRSALERVMVSRSDSDGPLSALGYPHEQTMKIAAMGKQYTDARTAATELYSHRYHSKGTVAERFEQQRASALAKNDPPLLAKS